MGGGVRSLIRGVTAVALLAGFYLLLLLVLVTLVGADIASISGAIDGSVRLNSAVRGIPVLLVITGVAAVAVWRAVTVSTDFDADLAAHAVQLDPAREPALFARVRELARVVGTRAPDEIWLVGQVNAAVQENARLLGLIPGRRRMLIGAPLLLALSPAQFDAVLAHELGHFSNRDTRFTAVIARGRLSLRAALESAAKGQRRRRRDNGKIKTSNVVPGRQTLYRIISAYAKLFFLVTQAGARRAEYAADCYSAAVAGREAAATALAAGPAIDAVHYRFLDDFASCGLQFGLAPRAEEFYDGFAQMLADPECRTEMERLRGELPERKHGKYDSHPPTADRIAAIRALPESAPLLPSAAPDETAVAILNERQELLTAGAQRLLAEAATGKRAVGWEELVTSASRMWDEQLAKNLSNVSTMLAGRVGTLPVVLELVDAGQSAALMAKLPVPSTLRPKHRAEMFRQMLWASISLRLEEQRRARRELSWSSLDVFVVEEPGLEEELTAQVKVIVDAAAAAGVGDVAPGGSAPETAATARLRELLKLG